MEDLPVMKCIPIAVAILSCPMVPVVQHLKPTIKRLHSSKHSRSSQSTVQKSRPPIAATSTTKPGDQYTTMTSRRQQQTITPSQQPAKESKRAEIEQKFYPNDYTSRVPPQQRQSTRDKDIVGKDICEAWFHYAPNPDRIKQLHHDSSVWLRSNLPINNNNIRRVLDTILHLVTLTLTPYQLIHKPLHRRWTTLIITMLLL